MFSKPFPSDDADIGQMSNENSVTYVEAHLNKLNGDFVFVSNLIQCNAGSPMRKSLAIRAALTMLFS